jgi:putative PIG3 family NAD(P)H quinone oxidoreductase
VRAVVADGTGDASVLHIADVPDPVAKAGEVLIRVAAAGVNRADLLQRMGFYPPPPGASPILGLEAAGEVVATGPGATRWQRGDRVMALLGGGGYAELVTVAETQVMRLPASLSLVDAGAVPEVFITAHDALHTRGRLGTGEIVLIHGGSGGVGTAAIQLAKQHGCRVAVTAGSDARLRRCAELGAGALINHHTQDFVAAVTEFSRGVGADVIVDVMGAQYLERNLAALAVDGRLVIIGLQGGTHAEIDLAASLRRRASIVTTHLRGRPQAQKAEIVARFTADVLPLLELRTVRPVIGAVFPFARAAEAHRALEAGTHVGKIVLNVAA